MVAVCWCWVLAGEIEYSALRSARIFVRAKPQTVPPSTINTMQSEQINQSSLI